MISRAKLVEQVREHQIRSHHSFPALILFSPKPLLISWADAFVAILSVLFSILVVSAYLTLYFKHFWIAFVIVCLGFFLPVCLRSYRRAHARKRERRMLLPLSM